MHIEHVVPQRNWTMRLVEAIESSCDGDVIIVSHETEI